MRRKINSESQSKILKQYQVLLDADSVMWVEKFSQSALKRQVYELIKASTELLENNELDTEELLLFDNFIYHCHKFIDSSKTVTFDDFNFTYTYYRFNKKYRDDLQLFLQNSFETFDSKCQLKRLAVCQEDFLLKLR